MSAEYGAEERSLESGKPQTTYRGVPLERVVEKPKLITKRCATSAFDHSF